MSSSLKYILYLTTLHVSLGVLAYWLFSEQKGMILVAELLILLSAYVAFKIYRSIISPLQLLGRGAAALQDQDFSVKLMPTGSMEMDRIGNIYNRMIDQLRQERVSSRQQEEFLDLLLDSAELGVVVLDFDWQIASMNDWTTRKAADPAFHTAVLQPALHLRPRQNQPKSLQQDIFTGPGNRRYHVEAATFVDRGFERGFLIIQDVTTELLAAEKDAYGKVIRMMAHEVNNSNAAIVSLLRSILEAAEDEDPQLGGLNKDYLPVVINRAENMTTFMRNFARVIRLPTAERKRVDLNELLHRTGEVMATVLADYNIELRYTLHPDPVFVLADPSHLEQVVVNALTNARESIGKAGVIRISTSAFPASFVIADNGPGIPEAVADKLFTPFYSTKPTGQGVGLTLTRDILEAHGASYSLRTEEDGWTRLMVKFLPEN